MTRHADVQSPLRLLLAHLVRSRSNRKLGLMVSAIIGGVILLVVNCKRERDPQPSLESGGQESTTKLAIIRFPNGRVLPLEYGEPFR